MQLGNKTISTYRDLAKISNCPKLRLNAIRQKGGSVQFCRRNKKLLRKLVDKLELTLEVANYPTAARKP